ncbi:MAG: hypothetical protein JSS61_02505 [Verrucomicrobia bacterium]|nr:hypothetical protein [Verrucomicrobiota bacterium]
MKKALLLLLMLCSSLRADEPQGKADFITYDWLLDFSVDNGITEHVPVFREIFKHAKIKTLLEFGMGYSTKYFLDHCKKVISVELLTSGFGPLWTHHFLSLYEEVYNWFPIMIFSHYEGDTNWAPYKYLASEHIHKAASYHCATHKDYAAIDDFYLKELGAFISGLAKCHTIDLAFVDSGLYLHGDLTKLLFNQVPIIVAHNTWNRTEGVHDDLYGYSKIQTPENYIEIVCPLETRATVWVLKNAKNSALIERLKEYAEKNS